jgi:hypothetical protein
MKGANEEEIEEAERRWLAFLETIDRIARRLSDER